MALISGSVVHSGAALSDADLAVKEAKVTMGAASDENASLKEKMLLQETTIKALTDSLTNVTLEGEGYKREAVDLRMKIEALGLPGDKSGSKLQERLLAAVSDLRLAQRSQEQMRNQLLLMSESVVAILKSSDTISPELRLGIETQLRSTAEMLGAGPASQNDSSLLNGAVIEVKDDLSLVVANIGKKQDVKVGMPFQVIRNNEVIGEIRVVDVRDRICGAMVQNLASQKQRIQIGDQLKVEARQ
ncbi:MAG: hypothetical protein ABIP97_05280 [Chthoniobacterales bacterium]